MKQASTMVSLVEGYLAARRQMGFALEIAGEQLLAFGRFADESGHRGSLTTELMIGWAQNAGPVKSLTSARRLEVLRPFAKYCSQFDPATEIVPRSFFGPAHRRLVPHIYSESEIGALLKATDSLLPADGLRPLSYRTLFGLLAATGMRISEALHLKPQDLDLDRKLLTVCETKFRKTRLVPLHCTTVAALTRYIKARQRKLQTQNTTTFLVSDCGKPLVDRTVHSTFEKLRAGLGWVARGDHAAPRIHDLRHSFICKVLLRSYQQHQPIDNIIDALSTYVGHAKVSDTYWYVTAIPELMAIAAERFAQFAEGGAR
jgi:integrase